MTTPRTAAGRALLAALRDSSLEFTSREAMAEFVIAQLLAIEAEAAAAPPALDVERAAAHLDKEE